MAKTAPANRRSARPGTSRARTEVAASATPTAANPSAVAERVIGVGASAGGLEALTAFLRPLPTGLAAAIVIAQHMSHTHPSLLVQLLARETTLPVVEITEGMQPRPGVVHVAPPRNDVVLTGTGFVLLPPRSRRLPAPSVDRLFQSIANARGPNAIGIVLSGTGSDGAAGLRDIRAFGGATFVQDPESATA